ncbi:MAG TPA: DUF5818 domain-containing protein [Candidatus Acidoferrales bacterium]|jgi:hypothetical protein|nr:DUF5818 domain-containing protein [Candidatus Acidoferrales bacterium]
MLRLKKLLLYFGWFAVLFALCAVPRASGEEEFTGMIADSQCAMNVHSLSQSHKEMLASKEAGTTNADCVWYCVSQRGGRFVLQNKNKIYKLDKQDIGKKFAGNKVRVTGTLDPKTNTIHVMSIELIQDSGT